MSWAIRIKDNNNGGEHLLSRYHKIFFLDCIYPVHLSGYSVALFSDRQSARAHAKYVKEPGIRATVVRVRITVEVDDG